MLGQPDDAKASGFCGSGPDYDGGTLEKAHRKKVGNYGTLCQEAHPDRKIEQTIIVVGATGVFHKRSQIEFAKATRSEGKDLARWQQNAVDMAILAHTMFVSRAWNAPGRAESVRRAKPR
jgi:hypothetical protein